MPSLHRYSDESGVALVEMALVLPVLLVLVFGMVDFARAMNYWVDGTHLANVTARYAAVNKPVPASVRPSTADRRTGMENPAATPPDPDRAGKVVICVSYPAGTNNVGETSPCPGRSHRTSVSTPVMAPSDSRICGW